jgi:hypothetical protein
METQRRREIVMAELTVLLRRLKSLGFETSAESFVDLELEDLLELRRQLRDTLRTIGGVRD